METEGIWEVKTHSSHYILNFEEGMLLRRPVETALPNQFNDTEQFAVADLRKDGSAIPFQLAGDLKVGQDMILVLQIRDDGILTHRRTTPVVWMKRL